MSTLLENAHKIARAASCMDDLRTAPIGGIVYQQCIAAAAKHAKNLHDIATELAGDHVDEVYCPDDATSLTLEQTAGRTCTCEA